MDGEMRGGMGSTTAFLCGVAFGAVAGMLMAPQPGKETRDQLRDQAEKAAQRLREGTQNAKNTAVKTADAVGRSIGNAREAAQAGADTDRLDM